MQAQLILTGDLDEIKDILAGSVIPESVNIITPAARQAVDISDFEVPETAETPVDISDFADRDTLLKVLAESGVVPRKGTKTPTLRRMVNDLTEAPVSTTPATPVVAPPLAPPAPVPAPATVTPPAIPVEHIPAPTPAAAPPVTPPTAAPSDAAFCMPVEEFVATLQKAAQKRTVELGGTNEAMQVAVVELRNAFCNGKKKAEIAPVEYAAIAEKLNQYLLGQLKIGG